jgi:hypothetical protein
MSNIGTDNWAGMPGKDRRLRRRLNSIPPMSTGKKAFLYTILFLVIAAMSVSFAAFISSLIPPRPM